MLGCARHRLSSLLIALIAGSLAATACSARGSAGLGPNGGAPGNDSGVGTAATSMPSACSGAASDAGAPIEGKEMATLVEAATKYADAIDRVARDVDKACRAIVPALGAEEPGSPSDFEAWCVAGAKALDAIEPEGNVDRRMARCLQPLTALTDCLDRCGVGSKCPPSPTVFACAGGARVTSCAGTCSNPSAPVGCRGKCAGDCLGACTADEPVACQGICDGTCEGGDPPKCACTGTCTSLPPATACPGRCDGSCTGPCIGSASDPVECDGMCAGRSELVGCVGGHYELTCAATAVCKDACLAETSAATNCERLAISWRRAPKGLSDTARDELLDSLRPLLTLNGGYANVLVDGGTALASAMKALDREGLGDAARRCAEDLDGVVSRATKKAERIAAAASAVADATKQP